MGIREKRGAWGGGTEKGEKGCRGGIQGSERVRSLRGKKGTGEGKG